MAWRTIERPRRSGVRPSRLRERAQEAARYVATRRRGWPSRRLRRVELALRALAVGLLFGLALIIADQVVVAATAALNDVGGRLQHLLPVPVIEGGARPSGEVAAPNAAPVLDALDRTTKEARLVVSGRVPAFALGAQAPRIEIFVNGALAATPAVDSAGRFAATVVLTSGTNTVVVAAVRGGERAEAAPRTLTLDTIPPPLTITRPADTDAVDGPSVFVEGKTEPGASVTVNGHATGVTADGGFSDTLQSGAGPLTIEVVARDQAGNETKRTLHVTMRPTPQRTLGVLVTLDHASVRPGAPVSVDVLVTDQGLPLGDAAVLVSVSLVTMGTGRTDAGGHYRAIVVAPATEGIAQVVAVVNGTNSSGRGAASLEVVKN